MRVLSFGLVALALTASSPAHASGEVHVGLATVSLENGHSSGCVDPSGLCVVTASGSGADATLDATQNVAFVGVAIDDSEIEAVTGYPLLPDDAIIIDSGWLVLRHEAFVVLAQQVGRTYAPAPADHYGLIVTSERYGVAYFGPPLQQPTGDAQPRELSWNYSDDGVGYRQVGPFGSQGNTSSDARVLDALTFPCVVLRDASCQHAENATSTQLAALTPNVEIGLSFYQVGMTTELGGFPSAAFGARASGSRPAAKAPVAAAPLPLAKDPDPPTRLTPAPVQRPQRSTLTSPQGPAGGRGVPSVALETLTPTAPPDRGVVLVAASFALALALAALFSRFHGKEALEHAKRKRILELLDARGPMSFPEVGRALGVDRTTVDYHVRLLIKTGFVKTTRGGRVVYVHRPGQEIDPSLRRSDADASDALLGILRGSGGCMPRGELHHAAGAYSQRARNGALQRLIERGVVERAFEGNVEIVRFTSRAEVNAS